MTNKTLYESLNKFEQMLFNKIDSALIFTAWEKERDNLKILKALIEKYERGFKQE